MDFVDTMKSLFGFNPATGETLDGSRIPTPRMSSGATPAYVGLNTSGMSQEATDPTTPSPQGQVLATLRTEPRRLGPRPAPAAATPSWGNGVASEIAGGMDQVKPGMSRGQAFFAGFSGATKAVNNRLAAAAKAQQEADKAKLDVYKTLFDIQDKQAQRARSDRQDAETKRWHDIMAPSYASNKDKKDGGDGWDDLSALDQSNAGQRFMHMAGIPDLSKADGQAAWDMLKPEERDKRIKILRRLSPKLASKIFDADGAPTGAPPPGPAAAAPQKSQTKTPAKDSESEDGEEDVSAAVPKNPAGQSPATPASAPSAAPAAPAPAAPSASAPAPSTWRRYKSTNGTYKLFNPETGQTQEIGSQAQPSYQQEYEDMGRALGAGR